MESFLRSSSFSESAVEALSLALTAYEASAAETFVAADVVVLLVEAVVVLLAAGVAQKHAEK